MSAPEKYKPVKQWYKKKGKWYQTNSTSRNAIENEDPRKGMDKLKGMITFENFIILIALILLFLLKIGYSF
jgi:hypothetical protein